MFNQILFASLIFHSSPFLFVVLREVVDELMPEPTEAFPVDEDHDILMTQRSEEGTENLDNSDPLRKMPPEIKRLYEVYIKAFSKGTPFTVAVYTCEECGFEIYQERRLHRITSLC
ncbi:hypothetical protein MRB53_005490 [Persea americana]|uniref:Uncharacterized protein n=1 Tax=Persea americana TaxID=3435 RepID=A0ACC2MF14_PERAE|nr:hypothetical protein MRB53_005490 [Persea americana]